MQVIIKNFSRKIYLKGVSGRAHLIVLFEVTFEVILQKLLSDLAIYKPLPSSHACI